MALTAYEEEYKDTYVGWIGEIPKDWEVSKVKFYFIRKNNKSNEENPIVLSLARSGVKIRDIDSGEGQLAESYCGYNPVKPGDLLLNPMDLISGANCSLSEVEGVISPAYVNLGPLENTYPKYYDYYFKTQYWSKALFVHGKGVSTENRWTLTNETIMNYFIPVPNYETQKIIATFLDDKTSQIDSLIEKNQRLIELLEEKRTSLINQVVTKGLDPDAPMKDSGIDWIGEIPEQWEVDYLKHRIDLNSKTLTDTTESNYEFDYVDIGSVSISNGIEKYEHMIFEESPSRARRVVKKDDVIISTVRTYLKAIAIIPDKEDIIVSTGFAVLTPTNINSKYLGYFVKTDYFVNLVSANSVGVSYPAINSTELVNLKVLIPLPHEQIQIAKYLDNEISKINITIKKIQKENELLEEYKQSLIYNVVTGKVKVEGE